MCLDVIWYPKVLVYLKLTLLTLSFTRVIKRTKHDHAKHDINRNAPGHLNVGLSVPLSVFLHWKLSLVPVFKWRGNIKAQEKMNKLVQIVSINWELSWCVNLNKKSDKYLCPCQNEEKDKGPLNRKSCEEWIGGRYSYIRIGFVGVVPSVKISPEDCLLYQKYHL